jgi:cardiolipin synthase A/B
MPPVRRAFYILFIAAIIVAGLLLIAQDQETLKLRSDASAEDPRHPSYIAALVGTALTHGNRYEVLTNGDRFFPAMLEAIRSAKRRISFETYVYKKGTMADQFTAAFEEACRRGVRVNLIIDSVGGGTERDHDERLQKAGCSVAMFNAPTWYKLEEINYRTHRKILVVDGEVGFTGGAGIDDQWTGDAQDGEHWRDTQFLVRGPVATLLEAAFYENFAEAAGHEVTPVLDDLPATLDTEGASLLLRSSPTGGSNDLKRLYLLSIASARRTLDIATPYFVIDSSSEWALADAVARGVKIRILVESDITDAMPVKYAGRFYYERLLERGVEIYEYQPTMMHAKTLVVDGIWSMFGSANFDNRSLELNDELNIAVSSRTLAARILADFEQDLRKSRRIELEAWRKRSLLQKTREKMWAAFGEIF